MWALFEDDDDYSPIFSKSSLNESTSPKFIERQRNKIAKQFRSDKKTSKRSKQTRVNVINNKDLDVLQNTLIDYFKDRTSSTKDLLRQESLLKKIENTFKKHLIEHTTKGSKLRRYFKKSLHKYHKKHIYF